MKSLLKFLVVIALLSVALVPSTLAQDKVPDPIPTDTTTIVTGAMVVDCNSLDAEGLAYAQAQGICATNGSFSHPDSLSSTQGTSTGNCGSVTLTISDSFGSGSADFFVRVQSFLGPITSISYSIPWTNLNTTLGNTVVGGRAVTFVTTFQETRRVFTGAGTVTGVLTGTAFVNAVLRCDFIPTADSGFIN